MLVHSIICSQVVDALLILATTWACVTVSCRILYSGETCSYGLTADSSIHMAHQTSYLLRQSLCKQLSASGTCQHFRKLSIKVAN